jgi:fructose-specific phosphotransferase system IIC component
MYGAPGRFKMGICTLKKIQKEFFPKFFLGLYVMFSYCVEMGYPISWMAWVVGLGWIQKHATPG